MKYVSSSLQFNFVYLDDNRDKNGSTLKLQGDTEEREEEEDEEEEGQKKGNKVITEEERERKRERKRLARKRKWKELKDKKKKKHLRLSKPMTENEKVAASIGSKGYNEIHVW